MTDPALGLLLQRPFPAVQPVVGLAIAAFLDGVQQVEIEVFQAGALQLFMEDAVPVRLLLHAPGGQLGGHGEAVSRMALGQRLPDDLFRIAAVIDIGRVKVGQPRVQIGVDHPAHLGQVDLPILLRQPHQAEAQLRHFVQINAHIITPCNGASVRACA